MHYDEIGKQTYNENFKFVFNCELLEIVNDKIRIHYWIPVNDPDYHAHFYNDVFPDMECPWN